VTAWRFSVGTSDGFDFQIWKDVDLGTGTATFVGRNTVAETQINSSMFMPNYTLFSLSV
jgi:hypothetical protein